MIFLEENTTIKWANCQGGGQKGKLTGGKQGKLSGEGDDGSKI